MLKLHLAVLLALFFACESATNFDVSLPPPEKKYKILMLLAFTTQSHLNCFLPLAETLADRGHQVVILSSLPTKSKHPNVTGINHGVDTLFENIKPFHLRETDPFGHFSAFKVILPKLARELYTVSSVKELYRKRHEYDLLMTDDLFNEPIYPFMEGRNYIAIGTAGILPDSSAVLGNVQNPAYFPDLTNEFQRPYTFWQRIKNLYSHMRLQVYWRYHAVFPQVQAELWKHFPNLPPLSELERGMSLLLVNTHFTLDIPVPLLPSQVEVGGMHCHPGNELPKDLQTFLDESGPEGVIYFSLGSVCKGTAMPEKYRKIVLEVFKRLKTRIIWKFEGEIEGLPENVMLKSWLPQQDVLAHPKVKLFIMHAGLLSMQESIYHATPLLALPIIGDQERNAQRIVNKGFGRFLFWEELTPELLEATIKEVIYNPKYEERVKSVSASFRDQPTTALQKAVWWTEYVIRHNGAKQLRSPAMDLSWTEYLMIDVLIVLHVTLFLAYWVVKKIITTVLAFCFTSKTSQKKRKSE